MMNYIEDIISVEKAKKFIENNKRTLIKAAAAVGVIIIALVIFNFKAGSDEIIEVEESSATAEEEKTAMDSMCIYVDIGGAVKSPMLVELSDGSRVEDAIRAAGGITDEADMSSVNRAAFVEDGEKVYIPYVRSDDVTGEIIDDNNASGYSSNKVNINTADLDELQELTGVGPATAQKIIDYRESNGRFNSVDDIKNVSGIGDKTFEKMKDDIIT